MCILASLDSEDSGIQPGGLVAEELVASGLGALVVLELVAEEAEAGAEEEAG